MDFNWRGGRGQTVHLKITYTILANLFGVEINTVRHWVSKNKLDPSNLLDIIEKYNNRSLLDKRRKPFPPTNK